MASWKTIAFLQTRPRKKSRSSVWVDLNAAVEPPRLFYDIVDVSFKERKAFSEQQDFARRFVQIVKDDNP